MFELWDRVTGNQMGEYETEEEARRHIPTQYAEDFVVIEVGDDE